MGFFGGLLRAAGGAFGRVTLKEAARSAPRETGIYMLYLNGRLMKVGKVEWKEGIRWRMQQYWRGDSTAGVHRSDIYKNREKVFVSWRLMPASTCREAEKREIQNAGGVSKLPWSERL